jgi:hypothetical protein
VAAARRITAIDRLVLRAYRADRCGDGLGRRALRLDRLRSPGHPAWLVAVALSPTAKTMVVTGGAGVRAGPVAAANVAGTVARVLAVWHAGRAFPETGETLAALAPWLAVPGGATALAFAAHRHRARRRRPQPQTGTAGVAA